MIRKITSTRFAPLFLHSRSSQSSPIFLILALTLLGHLLGSGPARGQATTSARGTVTDPSPNAVAGATVALMNAEAKSERTFTTGDEA